MLIREAAYQASEIDRGSLEKRALELKGKKEPANVYVWQVADALNLAVLTDMVDAISEIVEGAVDLSKAANLGEIAITFVAPDRTSLCILNTNADYCEWQ